MGVKQLHNPALFKEQAYIDGQWLTGPRAQFINNPATGEILGSVPSFGVLETKKAIESAHRAFSVWRNTTAQERSRILRDWFELMLENKDDLARIMTLEQGKPLSEALGEISYAASYLEWYSEEAKRTYGDVIPQPGSDRRVLVVKEPVGVCAAITPWNFPSSMITRKVGAALAAGCTLVLKPASQTPYSALALAALAEEAGVPAGVFSVVTGSASEIGSEMTSNSLVRKVSFTGSTEVGRLLMAQSAPQIKKLSLELGGNAPFIVFEDADIDAAVEGALLSKYRNMGQTCICVNRFYIHDHVYDEFAEKFVAAVKQLKVGNGLEEGVTQGPLIDEMAVLKVQEHITDVLAKGGRLLLGGKSHSKGGTFFEPTVLADVSTTALVAKEETFGPVSPLFRFHSEEEVIKLANDTEFGLASYFYSKDLGRAWRIAEALDYGMVAINSGLLSNEAAPFGGVKQSGLGREGSKYGLDDYMVIKYMLMGGI